MAAQCAIRFGSFQNALLLRRSISSWIDLLAPVL
jgi:hypothetical protein